MLLKPPCQLVDDRAARLGQAGPQPSVSTAGQVVREARQVVGDHPGPRIARRRQCSDVEAARRGVHFPESVAAGLGDEQVPAVARQRDAVREAHAADHQRRAATGRIVRQHAPRAGVLEDVEYRSVEGAELAGLEATRGIGEIHDAVASDHHPIGVADRVAVDLVGEHGNGAVAADFEQAPDGICNDQSAVDREVEAERPATGLGHGLDDRGSDLGAELGQLRLVEGPQVGRALEAREDGHGGLR